MKTYCWMFIDRNTRKLEYEYFNKLEEVVEYLTEYDELDLISLQRIWTK